MNGRMIAIGMLGISTALGSAAGQVISSGFLCNPLGDVTTLTPNERRLTACCLGSSGEDGVEVRIESFTGGGVGVDLSGLDAAGGEIRIRPKGWDGTIKGTLRVQALPGGGMQCDVDFSGIGATGCIERQYDADGLLIAELHTTGPFWAGPIIPVCTPPKVPTVWYTAGGQFVWGCGEGNNLYGDPYPKTYKTVSPELPLGVPVDLGIEAIDVVGTGGVPLDILDASIGTFGVSSWALGGGTIIEPCAGLPEPCLPEERALMVANIGSSGQDGVAIDLGDDVGGAAVARGGGNCCRGHVIIMKAFDDDGQELSRVISDENPASGEEILSFDFSGIGATDFEIVMEDASGQPMAAELRPNGGGIMPGTSGLCPIGSREWWIQNPDFSWTFVGCLPVFDLTVIGGGTYSGVSRVHVRPVNDPPTNRRLRTIEMTAANVDDLTIYAVDVHPECVGDVTRDGEVNLGDLALVLAAYGSHLGEAAYLPPADLNRDGQIDLGDLAIVLSTFGSTCN